MKSAEELDHLLTAMDVHVRSFAIGELAAGQSRRIAPADAISMIFVVSGELRVVIPGREDRSCGPGWIILGPPQFAFEVSAAGEGIAGIGAGHVDARMTGSFGLLDRATVPLVEDLSQSAAVREACLAMLEELSAEPALLGTRALADALMKSVILAVLRRFFRRPGISRNLVSALADPRLAGAVAAVLDEPGAPHSIASLATKAGLGRSTFARRFRERLGYSPMEFVAKTRMHYAADMLRAGEAPIKTIAAGVGFASRSHFSRAFREAHGVDPSAYRKQFAAPV